MGTNCQDAIILIEVILTSHFNYRITNLTSMFHYYSIMYNIMNPQNEYHRTSMLYGYLVEGGINQVYIDNIMVIGFSRILVGINGSEESIRGSRIRCFYFIRVIRIYFYCFSPNPKVRILLTRHYRDSR